MLFNNIEVINTIIYENGYAYLDGYKFRKDDKSGYYLSTRNIGARRKRLHVYVWEKHNGEIPEGYEIHHKDENKDNNNIDNLQCMTRNQHKEWHAENISDEQIKISKRNLDKARKKAKAWHSSEEGTEWHKKHAEKFNFGKSKLYSKKCLYCGKSLKSNASHAKYCSPNCRTQSRRVSGVDNETRLCVICGGKFKTNKYSKAKTCSIKCRGKLRVKNKSR